MVNRPDIGSYGTMFKTVPETTNDFTNQMTCFKIPGFANAEVTAQGILPNLTNYMVPLITYNIKSIIFVGKIVITMKLLPLSKDCLPFETSLLKLPYIARDGTITMK